MTKSIIRAIALSIPLMFAATAASAHVERTLEITCTGDLADAVSLDMNDVVVVQLDTGGM